MAPSRNPQAERSTSNGEVDVGRGVFDDVDAAVPPRKEVGRGGTLDGDPALLLLHHPVHGWAVPLVHLADLVRSAGMYVVEHPFPLVVVLPASM